LEVSIFQIAEFVGAERQIVTDIVTRRAATLGPSPIMTMLVRQKLAAMGRSRRPGKRGGKKRTFTRRGRMAALDLA
jgi:hypothetical protein